MTEQSQPIAPPTRWKWDPVVQVTHWGILLAVIANALFTRAGSGPHVWVGYGLAALLALRLLWGLIGPEEARFTAFFPSFRRVRTHLAALRKGEAPRYRTHNPLGTLNIYAMWACLSVIILTGITMAGPPSLRTPIAAEAEAGAHDDDDAHEARQPEREGEEEEEGPLGEVHEAAVYLLYLLIALHLGGVLFERGRGDRQIVSRMLPGRRA